MVLGTVELGLVYGINNTTGQPQMTDVFNMLNVAWNQGIRELDTASAYGNSEEIIGHYQEKNKVCFSIDTKMPVIYDSLQSNEVINQSMELLKCNKIHIIYLHRFEQCTNTEIISGLDLLKKEKKVDYIGVSIYEPAEFEYILKNLPEIDIIQFPFSILDNYRWLNNELLMRAKNFGKKLYARSVYLQGLVFRKQNDDFIKKLTIEKQIGIIRDICSEYGISVAELALRYVKSIEEIDEIILGCQSTDEILSNMEIFNKGLLLDKKIISRIQSEMRDIPIDAIDPRRWNLK